ncbi:unnamed protein product [Cuscuta epithymum]|uniref:Fanconi Anaemia group E protein C-terminal domain-containing protein n=1 Tax=Cuscuta epithymum TaxID=186058 RepID=A0AAV0G6I8_9ASTE|nr:unnamed protein product [Cuscuta epithymum]
MSLESLKDLRILVSFNYGLLCCRRYDGQRQGFEPTVALIVLPLHYKVIRFASSRRHLSEPRLSPKPISVLPDQSPAGKMKMESWVPLFNIFLNSTCPETDASLWLQQSFKLASPSISTTSFISLLTRNIDVNIVDPPSPSNHTKSVMWIRTLPDAVQARILSFLSYESGKFRKRDLCSLAEKTLRDGLELDFWVKSAAQQLLDVVSDSKCERASCSELEDEFGSLPAWLKDVAGKSDKVLPWLPISRNELISRMQFSSSSENDDLVVEIEEDKEDNLDEVMEEGSVSSSEDDASLDPGVEKMAACLKLKILNSESTFHTIEMAREIQRLTKGGGNDALAILSLIEPWKADDETVSILISHLVGEKEDEHVWSSFILCSFVLPKLLELHEPASRVLITAIVEYCKVYQKAAEYALLLPLMLKNGGINNPICDVITRIVKECLHPGQASSLCQRLICEQEVDPKLICLPCHQCLIGSEMVWTESLFVLMQNILNHDIPLTQDSVDRLVYCACECARKFSKSLKFCNFLLCLVNKCGPLLKTQKVALMDAVSHTSTLVTKSILSKLSSL